MVPAENKAKCLSSVNHTTKTIYNHHHHHSYNNCMLPENFRPRNRPSRERDYQVVWKAPTDGVRGLQPNFSTSKESKPG